MPSVWASPSPEASSVIDTDVAAARVIFIEAVFLKKLGYFLQTCDAVLALPERASQF
jgi:hypothetical protein